MKENVCPGIHLAPINEMYEDPGQLEEHIEIIGELA